MHIKVGSGQWMEKVLEKSALNSLQGSSVLQETGTGVESQHMNAMQQQETKSEKHLIENSCDEGTS